MTDFLPDAPVCVVDVQPGYDNWCAFLAPRLMTALNSTTAPVVALYVGDGILNDCEADIQTYWLMHGASEELVARTRFIEKGYGFFRGWMDMGIGDEELVEVVSYMRSQGLTTSDDLDDALLEVALSEPNQFDIRRMMATTIYLPPYLEDNRTLLSSREWATCGGGTDQCLKEVELWMQTKGLFFERANHLTY